MERGEPATGVVELPRIEPAPPVETAAGEDEEALAEEDLEAEAESQGEEQDTGEADAMRKRRRRQRRRGRGGEHEVSGNGATAPLPPEQPSDDGLALFANIGSDSADVGAPEIPESEEAEEPGWEGTEGQAPRREGRRRRPRRRGRGPAEEIVGEDELFHADRREKNLEEHPPEHAESSDAVSLAPTEPSAEPNRVRTRRADGRFGSCARVHVRESRNGGRRRRAGACRARKPSRDSRTAGGNDANKARAGLT